MCLKHFTRKTWQRDYWLARVRRWMQKNQCCLNWNKNVAQLLQASLKACSKTWSFPRMCWFILNRWIKVEQQKRHRVIFQTKSSDRSLSCRPKCDIHGLKKFFILLRSTPLRNEPFWFDCEFYALYCIVRFEVGSDLLLFGNIYFWISLRVPLCEERLLGRLLLVCSSMESPPSPICRSASSLFGFEPHSLAVYRSMGDLGQVSH